MNPLDLVEAPVAAMIPRALWPGKPILTTGYDFSQQYYGLPSGIYTSASITPIGDLFRHGGYLPVLVGMLILGGGTRMLDDTFNAGRSPHAIMFVLLFFPVFVKSEADWVTLLAGVPSTILIWLITVAVVFPRRRISSSRSMTSSGSLTSASVNAGLNLAESAQSSSVQPGRASARRGMDCLGLAEK
jgi:hypothetical protein